MEKEVEKLIKRAGDANDPDCAMKFAQAALNAANVILTLKAAKRQD